MKPNIKRLSAVFAGIVISLSVTPTLVAHAADGNSDVDALSATGTTNFIPPVPLVGGSGSWTFASSGPCAEVSAGIEVNLAEIVELGATCTVTGSGTYASIVCGFMTVAGTFNVNLTVTVPFVATETWTTTFTATIGDFQGPITGRSVEGTSSDGDNDAGASYGTDGWISYTPTNTGGGCMSSAFTALSLNVFETPTT
jgi:hypothetical protein